MARKPKAGAPADGLSRINHFVVLMLENRSFDHMLGFLYPDGQSPSGQPFEGLTGNESNPDSQGKPFQVFPIGAQDPNRYFYPKADPGEGFHNTNAQLFGTTNPAQGAAADNSCFIQNFAATLQWEKSQKGFTILPGTQETDIMGCFTPELLPVLSGLAKGYAVCDHWFCSAPTETLPNRAFALMATSQGHLDDKTRVFTAKSIFSLLQAQGLTWAVYGYTSPPLTRGSVADISNAPEGNFGLFSDFQAAVKAGTLANFVFLEPSWDSQGNSQHPNYDVALGEQFISQVYNTLFGSKVWDETLLVVTYDEHGGCYDHVAPPPTVAPDDSVGEFNFGFDRLGLRVPTILVSPWIPAGTVYRVPQGPDEEITPFDHTSLLKTVEMRFGLPSLTQRDAAATDIGGIFTLSSPRADNPLAGVKPPVNPKAASLPDKPTHLQNVQADLASRIPGRNETKGVEHHDGMVPPLKTGSAVEDYIRKRYQNAKAGPKKGRGSGKKKKA